MVRTSLTWKENYLRAIEFRQPEYIPSRLNPFWPIWNIHRERLESIALEHPLLFPGFKSNNIKYDMKEGIKRLENSLMDPFGCVWKYTLKGYLGQVVYHPLEKWKNFEKYNFPDPEKGMPVEGNAYLQQWEKIFEVLDKERESGELLIQAGLPHSFFFQRLYHLRGFSNLLKDFITKPPQIYDLIEALTEYNLKLVDILLNSGKLNIINFGDDIGLQNRMPISPKTFREFIFPAYYKIFQRVRSKGVHVYYHSDGHIIEISDQLIETGIDILNLQDRINGVKQISNKFKGKLCIDLDIDYQKLIPFGKPDQIKRHINHIVEELSDRNGGLMMIAELHPPTNLENIKALCEAIENNFWLK
jgi:hypothetical protein